MKKNIFFGTTIIAIALTFLLFSCIEKIPEKNSENSRESKEELKRFSSYEELSSFIKEKEERFRYNLINKKDKVVAILDVFSEYNVAAISSETSAQNIKSRDFSLTNIQVEGVDEADIVKTDGEYIYSLSNNNVVIVKAYPPQNAEVFSKIKIRGRIKEIFINKDKLVVFGEDYMYFDDTIKEKNIKKTGEEIMPILPPRDYHMSFIAIYDISDRKNPKLVKDVKIKGLYYNSRMIENYVYVIVNDYDIYYSDEAMLPTFIEDGEINTIDVENIYYKDVPSSNYHYIEIYSINLQNYKINNKVYLMPSAETTYVSQNNIYLAYRNNEVKLQTPGKPTPFNELINLEPNIDRTKIEKFRINDGDVEHIASGDVPGHLLNQFSLDEYNGNLRVATTIGEVSRTNDITSNNIYVLDEDLDIIGEEEGLAPGEKIYSARFMGGRVYLVTFKKVDPLFVIDLSNPRDPEVIGKLKIPGYSDYLHPYDSNHIIGIGKEAIEAEEGDFAWYQGLKIALFDVSDPENPKEISKVEIGDRGTDSYALRDHKAFLFDKKKELLVIPVTLAEIDRTKYVNVPAYQFGEFVFQGAYVFNINLNEGIKERGKITHIEDDRLFKKSGFYWNSSYDVKRSLYIEKALYTISDNVIKINNLSDLEELNKVELS